MNTDDEARVLRGQLVLALMDTEQARQALAEANCKVDELRDTVDGLCAQLERARAERDDACVELVRERGDTVALLWACASAANATSRTVAVNMASVATRIERGEHRREERA